MSAELASPTLFDRFSGVAPPERLAVVRVGVFAYAAIYLIVRAPLHPFSRGSSRRTILAGRAHQLAGLTAVRHRHRSLDRPDGDCVAVGVPRLAVAREFGDRGRWPADRTELSAELGPGAAHRKPASSSTRRSWS